VEIPSAGTVARRGNEPLCQPDQIRIGVLHGAWRQAQIVQLHYDFITRPRDGAWRGCDFRDARAQNIELRHINFVARPEDLVFAVTARIGDTIKWPQSGNVDGRTSRKQSGPTVLPNEHGVLCESVYDIIRIGITNLRFALS